MKIPLGPFLVDPPITETSGVDFLNLAQVGESLISHLLPGINAVTQSIRPYSFAAWVAWSFNEHLKAESKRHRLRTADIGESFRQYREKTELLFTWANRDIKGAIGRRRRYPEDDRRVMLQFNNPLFGDESQASWFAAGNYGASLSSDAGLQFVARDRRIYKPTDRGERAAKLLDGLLHASDASYRRLRSVNDRFGSRHDVEALRPGLRLDVLSGRERQIFRDSFYRKKLIGVEDGSHGSRSSSIKLILIALRAGGPMGFDDVRKTIALGVLPDGTQLKVGSLESFQKQWFALAVRQLQRVSLERLLRWLELKLYVHLLEPCDMRLLQGDCSRELIDEFAAAQEMSARALLSVVHQEVNKLGGIQRAGRGNAAFDVLGLTTGLEEYGRETPSTIPARSLYALLLCAVIVDTTQDDPDYKRLWRRGGRGRLSLDWTARYISDRADLTLAELVEDILVNLVYAQHLQTAAARVEPGKLKFRFGIDEDGIRPLIPASSVNDQGRSPDRIPNALLLMNECGLVEMNKLAQFTAAG